MESVFAEVDLRLGRGSFIDLGDQCHWSIRIGTT